MSVLDLARVPLADHALLAHHGFSGIKSFLLVSGCLTIVAERLVDDRLITAAAVMPKTGAWAIGVLRTLEYELDQLELPFTARTWPG